MNQSKLLTDYVTERGAIRGEASALSCDGKGNLYTYAVLLCQWNDEEDVFLVYPCRVSVTSSRHTNSLIRALNSGGSRYTIELNT
jgi:hypothetical protein